MSVLLDILVVVALAVGSAFTLLGAFSLTRLTTFFKRLHGPTKATTLGVGCVLLASIGLQAASGEDWGLREALVTVFLMVTAPVSAHLMARAGLQAGLAERPPQPSTGARANVEEADQEQPST